MMLIKGIGKRGLALFCLPVLSVPCPYSPHLSLTWSCPGPQFLATSSPIYHSPDPTYSQGLAKRPWDCSSVPMDSSTHIHRALIHLLLGS
jgi:hypothetical protein